MSTTAKTPALNWLREKATELESYRLDGENGEAWQVTRWSFKGTLPYRMAVQVRKELGALVKTDAELETLLIGGQYRSDFCRCNFIRATYQPLNA